MNRTVAVNSFCDDLCLKETVLRSVTGGLWQLHYGPQASASRDCLNTWGAVLISHNPRRQTSPQRRHKMLSANLLRMQTKKHRNAHFDIYCVKTMWKTYEKIHEDSLLKSNLLFFCSPVSFQFDCKTEKKPTKTFWCCPAESSIGLPIMNAKRCNQFTEVDKVFLFYIFMC